MPGAQTSSSGALQCTASTLLDASILACLLDTLGTWDLANALQDAAMLAASCASSYDRHTWSLVKLVAAVVSGVLASGTTGRCQPCICWCCSSAHVKHAANRVLPAITSSPAAVPLCQHKPHGLDILLCTQPPILGRVLHASLCPLCVRYYRASALRCSQGAR